MSEFENSTNEELTIERENAKEAAVVEEHEAIMAELERRSDILKKHPDCRVREEMGGNWYRADQSPLEGWLCPALFRYFEMAPAELFVKAEPLKR